MKKQLARGKTKSKILRTFTTKLDPVPSPKPIYFNGFSDALVITIRRFNDVYSTEIVEAIIPVDKINVNDLYMKSIDVEKVEKILGKKSNLGADNVEKI